MFWKNKIMFLLFGAMCSLLSGCYEVDFSLSPEGLERIFQSNGIVINNNESFTNNIIVNLKVFGSPEQEMYITNDPKCEVGGTWQPFSLEQDWTLQQTNNMAKVYVKFRSFQTASPCLSDDIIHDDTPPEVHWERRPALESQRRSDSFTFKVSDNLSGVLGSYCGTPSDYIECGEEVILDNLDEGLNNLSYFAKDRANNVSEILEYQWLVDWTAPNMRWIKKPLSLSVLSEAYFEFEATDENTSNFSFECRLNDFEPQSCENPYNLIGLSDGSYQLIISTSDTFGNTASLAYQWVIDTQAPDLKIVEHPGAYTNQSVSTFRFLSIDVHPQKNFECSIDGSFFHSCPSPFSFSTEEGVHRLQVRTWDQAGNMSKTLSHDWLVDLTPPVLALLDFPEKLSNKRVAQMSFSVEDDGSGIESLRCSLNGVESSCLSPIIYSDLSDGLYHFEVSAEDKSGNLSVQFYDWELDATPPELQMVKAPLVYSNESESVFEFLVLGDRDPQDFECAWDSPSFQPCSSPLRLSLPEGEHRLQVRTRDQAGNMSKTLSHDWLVDLTPPVLALLDFPKKLSNERVAQMSFSVEDDGSGIESLRCSLNGVESSCLSPIIYSDLSDGLYHFEVSAEDKSGNLSVQFYDWELDATPPELQMVKAPLAYSNESESVFEFLVLGDRDPQDFECAWDSPSFQPCSSPLRLSLPEGEHRLQVRTRDQAGNMSKTLSHDWLVDLTPPVLALLDFPEKLSNERVAQMSFSVEDDGSGIESLRCSLNGVESSCLSPIIYSDLSDGLYHFEVSAEDKSGNLSVQFYDWELDATPPELQMVKAPLAYSNESESVFEFLVLGDRDPQDFECAWDSPSFQPCSSPLRLSLPEGEHRLQVRTRDQAGNMSKTLSHDWLVDL